MIPHVAVIIVSNYEDWEALYIDGVAVYQHHSVTTHDLGEALVGKAVVSFTTVEVKTYDEWEVQEYPKLYTDIPEEAKL